MKTAALFRDLHSMLTHAGVISRLLWPGGKPENSRNQRAAALRELLQRPATDHILCCRALRDDLEHFDERLDSWVDQKEVSGDYWQDCIGPWEVPIKHGAKERSVMRHFDPEEQTFRFQGKPVHVPEIGHAVAVLQRRLDDEVAQLLSLLYQAPDHLAPPEFPSVMLS